MPTLNVTNRSGEPQAGRVSSQHMYDVCLQMNNGFAQGGKFMAVPAVGGNDKGNHKRRPC